MPLYKVVKEEGVTVDGVDFAKDAFLEVNPEQIDVSELLAEGSIVVEEISEDEEEGTHQPDQGEA